MRSVVQRLGCEIGLVRVGGDINDWRCARYLDDFCRATNLQRYIHGRQVAGLNRQAFAPLCLEALCRDGNGISAGRQVCKPVVTGRIRIERLVAEQRSSGHLYVCGGYDRSGRIFHRSLQPARRSWAKLAGISNAVARAKHQIGSLKRLACWLEREATTATNDGKRMVLTSS